MKKFKDFVFAFCWMLSCDIIFSDLGLLTLSNGWSKYIVPIGVGLTWAFFIMPRYEKRKMEASEASKL